MRSMFFTRWLLLFCASSFIADELNAAELIQLTEKNFEALCPRGKEVDAIYGDWVLRNEHIVTVIGAPKAGRNANMTVRNVSGMLIDFTARAGQSDQLSCFYPAGNRYTFTDPASVVVIVDGRQVPLNAQPRFEARQLQVTFTGSPLKGQESQASVTYLLGDGDTGLGYRVELFNKTEAALPLPAQDLIRCDGATFKFGNEESSRLFWAEERFYHQAYGLLLESGTVQHGQDSRTLTIADATDTGDTAQANEVAPGKSRTWAGKLFCSQGLPGLRALAQAVADKLPTQTYQLKLNSRDGDVQQAEVEITADNKSLGIVSSDNEGLVRLRLTPGEYAVKIQAVGRDLREHTFKLGTSPLAESLTLHPASRVAVTVTDQAGRPLAAKLQFLGRGSTESPNFGPDTNDHGVRNLLYTANGKASAPIVAGQYEIIASHGPEYDMVTQTIEVRPGQSTQVRVQLNKSVDTTGWVSGEFHSHSTPSGDNTSMQRGRVLNLLAENLEFAPCTEHNRIDTYAEHLIALRATDQMATCTGMELTGSLLPVNHQNAFPLHRHPHVQDGGGPTTDADPIVQIQRLAMWDDNSDKVVQINHPNIPQILGDRDADGVADEGFGKMFDFMDVIEVDPLSAIFTTPTADLPPRDRSLHAAFYWMQLLNLGYHTPGVVNTDAHYNYHGSGWLRNYIASSTDDPAKISTEEMVRVIQAGNMVMTTAPFLQVELRAEVDGQPQRFNPGDRVALGTGPAKLWIRVQCANWYDINRVQVFANGRPHPQLNFTRTTHGQMFGNTAVRFEAEMVVPELKGDTHLIATAVGEGLTLGTVMGDDRGKLTPIAVANPIYVDVDGDKFKPNGDNLGVPFLLPPGKQVSPDSDDSSK